MAYGVSEAAECPEVSIPSVLCVPAEILRDILLLVMRSDFLFHPQHMIDVG